MELNQLLVTGILVMLQSMSHILQLEPQNLQTKPQTLEQTTARSTDYYKLH